MKTLIIGLKFFVFLIMVNHNCTSNKRYIDNYHIQVEKEIEHLKNQAYCDLQNKLLKSNTCITNDASGYMHISNLDIIFFKDPNLQKIIIKWAEKEYKAYEDGKNLNTMKCLDFYNSKDLKIYLDSVRVVLSNGN